MPTSLNLSALVLTFLLIPAIGRAQFMDGFDTPKIEGWFTMAGDGSASIEFVPHDGFARMLVDGTQDQHNVWWTFIKRDITAALDLEKLKDPAYELRVEALVRASHAPRRVNFMINTQRTTDFHEQLREYDIPDTTGWHTISMTTNKFDAVPGDKVFVQLCVTDWGPGNYHLDVDYYRADVVRRDQAEPDKGEPLIYHPPIRDPKTFSHHLGVAHDSVINSDYPKVNFNDWQGEAPNGVARILTVDAHQSAILRWNFDSLRSREADGAGILELTTHSVQKGGNYIDAYGEDLGVEFGKIRVIEILGGDPDWKQESVTYDNLLQGETATDAFNTQMISDVELSSKPGSKTYVTLSRPVMQRLLEGRTKGLVIRPLGALVGSFHASENTDGEGPKLHFSTKE